MVVGRAVVERRKDKPDVTATDATAVAHQSFVDLLLSKRTCNLSSRTSRSPRRHGPSFYVPLRLFPATISVDYPEILREPQHAAAALARIRSGQEAKLAMTDATKGWGRVTRTRASEDRVTVPGERIELRDLVQPSPSASCPFFGLFGVRGANREPEARPCPLILAGQQPARERGVREQHQAVPLTRPITPSSGGGSRTLYWFCVLTKRLRPRRAYSVGCIDHPARELEQPISRTFPSRTRRSRARGSPQ